MQVYLNRADFIQLSILLLVISIIYICIVELMKHTNFVRKVRKLPSIQPLRFLIGNLYEIWINRSNFTDLYLSVSRMTNERGGLCVFWTSYYPAVLITSWEYASKILRNKKFLSRGVPETFPRGIGILSIRGEEWRARRALISPSFAPNVIKSFIPKISENVNNLISVLESLDGNIVEPIATFEPHILSMILETSLGFKDDMDDEERSEILNSMRKIVIYLISTTSTPLMWIKPLRKIFMMIDGTETALRKLFKYAKHIIDSRMEEFSTNENKSRELSYSKRRNRALLDSLLEVFIHETVDGKHSVDHKVLIDELLTVMITNYETTLSSSIWLMHSMASNPTIQEKLFQELSEFDEPEEAIEISRINELTFLDQCVKENLRIHPPVCIVGREISEDTQLDGYLIPKGTQTLAAIYSIHHDERIYPDPEKFDPSRFEPDNSDKIPSGAFLPFGDGPRRCIGERLAILGNKIIISKIIKKFRIVLMESENVELVIGLILKPKSPLKFRFVLRDQAEH
ncbi:cytochrome P450 4V2-like [Brevipalpus obovatus]|uniref:cytochrome P450 4V2-like n=1 Tax=Brevipalpus obovatus TaxID=246614 RepID=UPI003D9F4418